ncbi:hypothetical protein ELE36_00580 [Pseudolysobacter antarcticus]|uniref:Delta-60 repeat domain-containing protein n=1 Tax=Pseudolysobacter antarcticus TaxID=2511995 RepID=A0A411HES8_9GAMM|nr:SBBP repeat-containing protein [Pseudolysobacter antarcticus]QBB68993.1 hypothetical protein ELE36_00580 [Pseudolysobacter antarcticus]
MPTMLRQFWICCSLLCCCSFAWATREGDPDPKFNTGQNVTLTLPAAASSNPPLGVLGIYKSINIGDYVTAVFYKNSSGTNFSTALVRQLANGQPNPYFSGANSKVVLSDPGKFMTAMAPIAAIDSTVMVGYTTNGNSQIVVCRYTDQGLPDSLLTGHDSSGCIYFAAAGIGGPNANGLLARAVIVQPVDSKIVIAGSVYDVSTGVHSLFVMRLSASGALDTSFGNAGIFIYAYNLNGGKSNEANALKLDASNRILIAGDTQNGTGSNYDFAVLRLTPAGAIDQCTPSVVTFACAISFDFHRAGDYDDSASAIAIDSVGSIYVAGTAHADNSNAKATAVMRLTDQFLKYNFSQIFSQFTDFVDGTGPDDSPGIAIDAKDRVLLAAGKAGYFAATWRILGSGFSDPAYNNGSITEPGRVAVTKPPTSVVSGEFLLAQAKIFFDGNKPVIIALTRIYGSGTGVQLVLSRRLGDDTIFFDGFGP